MIYDLPLLSAVINHVFPHLNVDLVCFTPVDGHPITLFNDCSPLWLYIVEDRVTLIIRHKVIFDCVEKF